MACAEEFDWFGCLPDDVRPVRVNFGSIAVVDSGKLEEVLEKVSEMTEAD